MPQRSRIFTAVPLALVAAASTVVTSCAPLATDAGVKVAQVPPAAAPAPTTTTPPAPEPIRDVDGVQASLDAIADAFVAGDPQRLRPHLYDPEAPFGRSWLERVDNLTEVPLASYRLRLDQSLPDLATDAVRERYDHPVQVLYVVEELALEGFDDEPAAEDLFLTMVASDGGWKVAGDRDAEPLGLVSVDHLWDHGPVTATRDGPVLALHHPDGPAVGPLLEDAKAALADARQRWPLAWPERVPIIVPRDEEELGDLLHVTFDLSNFVAFATATSTGERGEYRLTGSRVVLNPDRFLDRDPATRQRILVHELIHVATRPVAGPMLPAWLDEGVAQALGERRSTTGTRLLDALATSAVDLPRDGDFTVGGRERVFLSYQLAWSFLEHLRSRFGDEAVARFYAEAGTGSLREPGTEAFLVDRAAREVLGAGLDDLVAQWRASR